MRSLNAKGTQWKNFQGTVDRSRNICHMILLVKDVP